MASGICVFAEHWNQELSPAFFELITAAWELKEKTQEPIQVLLAAAQPETLMTQMKGLPIDAIYAVKLPREICFQEERLARVYSEMLKEISPSVLLVPASDQGRSIFPRVAYRLGAGMTADCTELEIRKREDGSHGLRQIKPSFEANVKVCIECQNRDLSSDRDTEGRGLRGMAVGRQGKRYPSDLDGRQSRGRGFGGAAGSTASSCGGWKFASSRRGGCGRKEEHWRRIIFNCCERLQASWEQPVGGTRRSWIWERFLLRIRLARRAARFVQRSVCLLGSPGQCSTQKESRIQLCILL